MRILFVSGTRADFGKVRPLIEEAARFRSVEVSIAVTGMHMSKEFGSTWLQVAESGFQVHKFRNMFIGETMDQALARTIMGFSKIIRGWQPTHVVVHGDRLEALAGAISSSLNNLITIHVEGGELSGTIDESLRHAVTKLSLIHLVSNQDAKNRVMKLGENERNIHIIGSPELDVIDSNSLPELDEVRSRYNIPFSEYAVCIYHPVTTELGSTSQNSRNLARAMFASRRNFVVIETNNDLGFHLVRDELAKLSTNIRFRVLPSMRFEHYISLLRHSQFLLGNSSSGVREAPYLGVPSINIGSRQSGRNTTSLSILNVKEEVAEILEAMDEACQMKPQRDPVFGDGKSADRFGRLIDSGQLDAVDLQKKFYTSD